MPNAFVAGAANPIGRAVVENLASRGVATLAHIEVEVAQRGTWQKKLNFPMVRCDATTWEMSALTKLMAQLKPSHIFATLTVGWSMSQRLEKSGLSAGNYEVNDYKKTEMLIDAMVRARHEAHIVYLSVMGANSMSSGEFEKARGRAEQKIRTMGLPCTIVRAPAVIDDGPDRPRFAFDQMMAIASNIVLLPLRFIGARAWADRRRGIAASQLANIMVDTALSASSGCRVLEGDALRG